jgi:hypothetical protein
MTTEAIAKLKAEDPTIVHLDDLLLRRSTLYEDADKDEMQRAAVALGLEEPEMEGEIARCTPKLQALALEQK